jgi:hypothetical protein
MNNKKTVRETKTRLNINFSNKLIINSNKHDKYLITNFSVIVIIILYLCVTRSQLFVIGIRKNKNKNNIYIYIEVYFNFD